MKFLVTEECGRLARWLRLMGYDATQTSTRPFSDVYRTAYREGRIVLTRNRRVGASCLFRVVHLASPILEKQLQQLIQDVGLAIEPEQAFTRCDICNIPVDAIEKALVEDRVPPYVFQTQTRFFTCPSCHRIYWAATHWQRARALFERIQQ